jgi:putative tricarboxylic transport membrane protein
MDPALPPGAPAAPEAEPSASGPLAVGAVLLVAGVTLLWQAVTTGIDNGVALGGPTLAPIVVTGMWVVVASWYLLDAVRKRITGPDRIERKAWRSPALLLVALICYSVVLKYTVLGYVLATVAFVLVSARLLSSRPWREVIVRDVATAVCLSVGIYLLFTRLLGIVLPAGVLPL